MKRNARFTKSVVRTTSASDPDMPWHRGIRRADFIARRKQEQTPMRVSA